jgi:hypothetical protein
MEKKHFSLEMKESAKWAEILQIAFGILCITISIFLIVLILKSASKESPWIGIIFLAIFGFFQIWSGFGYAQKFIEMENGIIRLKINSISRIKVINASDIEMIESFPLNTIFRLKNRSKINLRFGMNYPGRIEEIVSELILFAEANKIVFEIKDDIV